MRFHVIKSFVLAAVVLVLGIGCGQNIASDSNDQTPTIDPTYGEVVQSDKLRDTSPEVSEEELATLVSGNRAFALDMYRELAVKEQGNLFFSPHSISQALAMTYVGARSQTEVQMADALHFDLEQAALHPSFNALDLALMSRGEGAQGQDDKGFRLKIANAIWGQKGYGFMEDYLDVLAMSYGAGLRLLDFENQTEQARLTINAWVSEQTEKKIPELLQPGDVIELTRMVLTNTIYFNAAWKEVFPEELTYKDEFALLDGNTVTTDFMTQSKSFWYTQQEAYDAIELPYDGEEVSMLIIAPASGQFEQVLVDLDGTLLQEIETSLIEEYVQVVVPKWEFRSKWSTKKHLKALGMTDAFDFSLADFSGINGGIEPLYVHDVVHEAFVSVDERGTEAAAATAVVLAGFGEPPPLVSIDRPFIFVIRDNPTGALLFVGHVLNPGA